MKPKAIRCWYCNSKHIRDLPDHMYYKCLACGRLFPSIASKDEWDETVKLMQKA
jgi:hypothetical protein